MRADLFGHKQCEYGACIAYKTCCWCCLGALIHYSFDAITSVPMHIELDKAIDLNYYMECAAIVLCKDIVHMSGFQSHLHSLYCLRTYVDLPLADSELDAVCEGGGICSTCLVITRHLVIKGSLAPINNYPYGTLFST